MNPTNRDHDHDEDADLAGAVRSDLHRSIHDLAVVTPSVDEARAVLGRAQRRQHERVRRHRTLVVAAVAAVLIVGGFGVVRLRDPGDRVLDTAGATDDESPTGPIEAPPVSSTAASTSEPTAGTDDGVPRIVLPGWTTTYFVTFSDGETGVPYVEYKFELGDKDLQVSFYAESVDRNQVGGSPVPVRGTTGSLLAYGAGRYRVAFPELQRTWEATGGAFVSPDDFLALVDSIQFADDAPWKASLPPGAVTEDDRTAAVDALLIGVPIPSGFDVEALRASGMPNGAYDLGAEVLGHVECAWIAQWLGAPSPSSPEAAEAVAAMATVPSWAGLVPMRAVGAYPAAMEQLAAAVVAGDRDALGGYRMSLGC